MTRRPRYDNDHETALRLRTCEPGQRHSARGRDKCPVRRVWEHKHDIAPGFPARYRVHALVWYYTMESAIRREKTLKEWKRRWKLELIEKSDSHWRDLYAELTWGDLLSLLSCWRRNDRIQCRPDRAGDPCRRRPGFRRHDAAAQSSGGARSSGPAAMTVMAW